MSEVGIPIDPVSLIEIALLLGSPGLVLGAVAGFAPCLGGWMFLNM